MRRQSLVVLSGVLLACAPVASAADVLPAKGAASSAPATRWEEAFVTGNGRMGAMLFGDPLNETFVANHCRLFLPLGSREIPADLAAEPEDHRRWMAA